jgi:8-amino-7-oxononanoate synthase
MTACNQLYTDQLPGRTVTVGGREYLYFSGTSYLGMGRNKQFLDLASEGLACYGTNYSSSRHSNLQLRVFEEAEAYLAAYTGAEAALTMSSGFLAGQALVHALAGTGKLLYAPGTHPALWHQEEQVPNDLDHGLWVAKLLEQAPHLPGEHLIICCNSLDPLKARQFDFGWLAGLPPDKRITLVVDDSHGFGVMGPDGTGIYSQLPRLANMRVVVVASLGKGLGIPAGFILGDKEIVAQVQASAYFGGASPAIPAFLYAFLQAADLFRQARQTLFANIRAFQQHLVQPTQFQFINDYPVFYTAQESLALFLFNRQALISSFRYPTPANDFVTRIVLSSLHTEQDLHHLATLINQFT